MATTETWRSNRLLQPNRRMIIDGQSVDAASGERIDVENPATGEVFTTVPAGSAQDVDRAVVAARRTFENKAWRGKKYTERAEIMWRWSDLVIQNIDELAVAETIDNGMPIAMAKGTVRYCANTIRYFAGMCSKAYGRTMEISLLSGFDYFESEMAARSCGVSTSISSAADVRTNFASLRRSRAPLSPLKFFSAAKCADPKSAADWTDHLPRMR